MVQIRSELQDQLNYWTVQNTQAEVIENHLQRTTGGKKKIVHALFMIAKQRGRNLVHE